MKTCSTNTGFICLALFVSILPAFQARADVSFPVTIRVDAAKAHGQLNPIWRFFGADEPNYAYMKHGKTLLAELGELGDKLGDKLGDHRPDAVFFRTHN